MHTPRHNERHNDSHHRNCALCAALFASPASLLDLDADFTLPSTEGRDGGDRDQRDGTVNRDRDLDPRPDAAARACAADALPVSTPMTKWWAAIAGVALVAAFAAGCDNDLPVASQLERVRVIGARVELPSDPGRAEVAPGEAATVSFIVAGPSAPATLDWAFTLCTGAGGGCKDQPQPIGNGSGAPVTVSFATPDAATLGTDTLPMLQGIVCADGTIGVDAATGLPSCTGTDASGTVTRFVVPIVPAGETPNRHPVLGNDVVQLGGVAWDATTATAASAGDACDASSGLPVVTATADGVDEVKQEIRIVSDADDRETYTPVDATEAKLEDLQISNFTTAGKFETSYGAIFSDDTRPDADVTVKWSPPKAADVPAGGQVVTFTFVVRDLRGGLDFTSRAACVVQP